MTRAAFAHVVAAIAAIAATWWLAASGMADSRIADAAPGISLAILALAAAATPRCRASGALAAIAAVLWFAGEWDALQWVHWGAIAWLVLAYPGARLRPRWVIAIVAVAYLAGAVPALGLNPIVTVATAGAVVATAGVRLARSPRIARRPVAAAFVAAAVLGAAWTVPIALRELGAGRDLVLAVYLVGTSYVGVLLLIDVTLDRSPDSAFVGVVIDLGGVTDAGSLRDRLARVVGDPQLWLGYRLADGRYVDDAGLSAPWGEPPPDRVVTPIDDDRRRVAVLVHDRSIRVDPALVPEIAAAVSLALRNVELHAHVRARVIAIEDSRNRLLEAENEARRGFAGALEDGPLQRLRRVTRLLWGIDEIDERTLSAADRADKELRRFGRGLHPAALDGDDLSMSLASLAEGLPLSVEVHADISRLTPERRAAVWYICAEALTNAAKHAQPTHVTVSVELGADDEVVLTVHDDGRGGASMDAGTGLRGIRERAEALRGRLEVDSPSGAGTVVRAWLPATSSLVAVTEQS